MMTVVQILVRRLADGGARVALGVLLLGVLAACGQRGPLRLPTDPAAAQRATLPQTVIPGLPRDNAEPPKTGGSNTQTVPAAGVGAPAGGLE